MGQKGAFVLGQVYNKQRSLAHPVAVSTSTQDTGYYSAWDIGVGTYGWHTGNNFLERIDFNNDTTTALNRTTTTLPNLQRNAAVGNANYAWLLGGGFAITSVFRIDFSNDGTSFSSRGLLNVNRQAAGGVGNANFGWALGGNDTFPTRLSSADRIDYSNDLATAVSRGNVLSVENNGISTTSINNYGWAYSGNTNSVRISTIQRIDFTNDSAVMLARGPLSSARYGVGTTGNLSYGYAAAGTNSTGPILVSIVERLDYSNDSVAALVRGNIYINLYRRSFAGSGNANYGWFAGGVTSPANISTVDRIDYANDSVTASIRGSLSSARYNNSSVSNYSLQHPTYNPPNSDVVTGFGWVNGGKTGAGQGTILSSIDRTDFTNDTVTASSRGKLSIVRQAGAASNNANYGWIAGGAAPALTPASTIDRIDFSTDNNTALVRGALNGTRYRSSALGNSNYSWFLGGQDGPVSSVDRLDSSNDSARTLVRGTLTTVRFRQGSTGNANYGWIGAGATPATTSAVDRIEYSNDLVVASTRGVLSLARYDAQAAFGNTNYAWFGAGLTSIPVLLSIVDRIDLSSDTATALARGSLPAVRTLVSGASNSIYGWFTGGYNVSSLTTVERINFSNDTVAAAARGPLSSSRDTSMSTSNYVKERQQPFIGGNTQGTYVWSMAGNSDGTVVSTIDRLDLSNDSATASVRGSLPVVSYTLAGLSEGNFGWATGGVPSPGGTTNVSRLSFGNDTANASARGKLSATRYGHAAVSNQTYGWQAHGSRASSERIEFSNDSSVAISRVGAWIVPGRFYAGAVSGLNYGLWAGGYTSSSAIERLDFGNDTLAASLRGPLTVGRRYLGGVSNTTYGWFAGGTTGTRLSTVDRVDFANDSVVAIARGPLTAINYAMGAAGNANYGYLTGGNFTSVSTTNRIDYSNDTATALSRGILTQQRRQLAAVSNYVKTLPQPNITQYNKGTTTVGTSGLANYGWMTAGGSPAVSTIDRIDFANDSITAIARGTLPVARFYHTGFGNAAYGWLAGGLAPPNINTSTVYRIDYSNDNTAASIKGTLPDILTHAAGMQSANYGWTVCGLYSGANASTTSLFRVDFANDSLGAATRGSNTQGLWYTKAASNSLFGWVMGGNNVAVPATVSSINRVDFSNDLARSMPRGPLPAARYGIAVSGNANFAWSGGGGPAAVSTVNRVNFSNDTVAALARGPLSVSQFGMGTVGNQSYGWFGGGGPALLATVSRIDYASDLATGLTRGSMTGARYYPHGLSNYVK